MLAQEQIDHDYRNDYATAAIGSVISVEGVGCFSPFYFSVIVDNAIVSPLLSVAVIV